jgi:hypothetical protein
MNLQQYYLLFKDFLIKNLSLISFTSILFGVIFYYTAGVLEVRNSYIIQLEKANKIYADLSQNQAEMLEKQQQIITNLETVVFEKLSSINDANALKWYALVFACTLFVGVAGYYSFKSNNSDPSSPSQPYSQANNTNAEFQCQMEKITKDVVDAAKEEFANMSQEIIGVVHNVRTNAVVESKNNISVEIDNVKIAELVSSEVNDAVKLELSQISETIKVGIKSLETVSNKGCQDLYGISSNAFQQMVNKSSNLESTNVDKVATSFANSIETLLVPQINSKLDIFEKEMKNYNDRFTMALLDAVEASTDRTIAKVNDSMTECESVVQSSILVARVTNRKFQELMENVSNSRELDDLRGRSMQASTKIMELRISIQKSAVGLELKSD